MTIYEDLARLNGAAQQRLQSALAYLEQADYDAAHAAVTEAEIDVRAARMLYGVAHRHDTNAGVAYE